MGKVYINSDVLTEAKKRIEIVFEYFPKIYLSFSGGKDSSVMMHLVMDEAKKRNRKIGILFVDLEAQYKLTINHVIEMYREYEDLIEPYWVCLPIALSNAVSVYQPKWQCWNPDKKDVWVRDLPELGIHDQDFFPFFKRDMEFEEFVPKFGEWFSEGLPTACFVGIRTDESLNRYRTITSKKKKTFSNYQWTTKIWDTNVYNAYPIYDWKTQDIWRYNGKFQKNYNRLYDLMSKAGLTIHQQRICQPYGSDQRKGLWLFHIIEPGTWSKIVARVNGANFGAEMVQINGNISGQMKITLPPNHTWESFSMLLLQSMPEKIQEHYKNKIAIFIQWHKDRGHSNGIPDTADPKEELNRKSPSWRRIAKMLLRNDYWAKGLSFTQTKSGFFYEQYMKRIKKKRKEWGSWI